jgi:DNA mismatch repair ATPase MutS
VVSGLVERGAIGICSTHDLALTGITEALGDKARNGHFGDKFEGGRLVFDYKLKPGVVTHTNAIELMRAVGLEVWAESRPDEIAASRP